MLDNLMVNRQEQAAMVYVRNWAEKQAIAVRNAERGSGYDYEFVHPNGKREKIEVKGTNRKSIYSIPDITITEFDGKRLKADSLFVVANALKPDKEKVLFRIPRAAIKDENLYPKHTYAIVKFQNKNTMERFRVMEESAEPEPRGIYPKVKRTYLPGKGCGRGNHRWQRVRSRNYSKCMRCYATKTHQ